MEPSGRVYTPGQAAAVLGVTTQSLRRYADDYGEVFEPILKYGKERVFDDLIVERLRNAQALQQQGSAASIKAALEMIRDGKTASDALLLPTAATPFEGAVLERLDALAKMLVQLSNENKVLQERLTAALPPGEPLTDEGTAPKSVTPETKRRGALIALATRLEEVLRRITGRT